MKSIKYDMLYIILNIKHTITPQTADLFLKEKAQKLGKQL